MEMNYKEREINLREGKVNKGGINLIPSSPRPLNPPVGSLSKNVFDRGKQ